MAWLRIALIAGILTAGCGEVLYQRFDKTMWSKYIHLNQLSLGMSQDEVKGIMGPPDIKEEGDYRGGHYVIYFYLTHDMDAEGSGTVRGGYTPLAFKNARLVGIGKRAYRSAVDRTEEPEFPRLPWTGVK
jgi:hypothetical protein